MNDIPVTMSGTNGELVGICRFMDRSRSYLTRDALGLSSPKIRE
jgi:hypothetical protein